MLLLATTSIVGLAGLIARLNRPQLTAIQQTKNQFLRDWQTFDSLVNRRLMPLAQTSTSTDSLQRAFLACRAAYKRIEPVAEYFFPSTTRLVNGPPLPEIEVEETKQFEPGGLQVIEEHLFPRFDPADRQELVREVRKLRRESKRYELLWEVTDFTDAHVFDVAKLQVFRVITLGVSGFDTPLCRTALPEAATSLGAVREYLRAYASEKPTFSTLQTRLERAEAYLRDNPDFDAFDRAHFMVAYANPITSLITTYQREQAVATLPERRLLRADAPTLFAANLFDPDALAPNADSRMNPAKVELGRQLFFDPALSANNQRSCASCHQPDKAFTDGLTKNKTLTGQGLIGRNTPTLLNAALQRGQFYDMRTASLEGQSFDVIHNKSEMNGSMEETARKLRLNPAYVAQFKKAFPQTGGAIQPTHIQNALASYERTLLSFDSRFDQYMRGNKTAMTAEELHGLNLFMGKAKCGICHFMPLFNGTVPPGYADTESEVIGTPATADGKQIDPDLGRYAHTQLDPLRYAFKTPTVRNIAKTAPYMHNGVYETLDEVVEFYNKGGGNGLGFKLDNQTLPFDKLNLTKPEKKAIVAFMRAL